MYVLRHFYHYDNLTDTHTDTYTHSRAMRNNNIENVLWQTPFIRNKRANTEQQNDGIRNTSNNTKNIETIWNRYFEKPDLHRIKLFRIYSRWKIQNVINCMKLVQWTSAMNRSEWHIDLFVNRMTLTGNGLSYLVRFQCRMTTTFNVNWRITAKKFYINSTELFITRRNHWVQLSCSVDMK